LKNIDEYVLTPWVANSHKLLYIVPSIISIMAQGIAWRRGIAWFVLATVVVFALNLSALLWSISHRKQESQNDSIVLREGSTPQQCASIKTMNTWLHLLINVLSTIILAGSNYCMQCLCAPDRQDINNGHQKGKYLDIGIPSLHNIKYLPRRRVWTWFGLLFSSLPLHLL